MDEPPMRPLFIGVDGGATKCVIRVEDEAGNVLGREVRGPANIRISVQGAWEAILSGLHAILAKHDIKLGDKQYRFHAGMGLAGCEITSAYQAFTQYAHPFHQLIVTSDAHTACLGAHHGEDGAIIIIGTGVVGVTLQAQQLTKVGGYGFPHDDRGGGAYLGLEAVNVTLRAQDGRVQHGALSQAVMAHFNDDQHALIVWANQANSTAFATLAPFVVKASQAGDHLAQDVMMSAANAIDELAEVLLFRGSEQSILPCALIGGLASYIQPYVTGKLKDCMRHPLATPDEGAILLVRENILIPSPGAFFARGEG